MPLLKTYILDDNPSDLQRARKLVANHQQLLLVGTATDPEKALPLIRKYDVEVLLLDLEMNPLNGWEVIKRLGTAAKVILCTVDKTAGEGAYHHNVVFYLVKPLTKKSLDRAIQQIIAGNNMPPPVEPDHVWVTSGGASRQIKILLADIEAVRANGDYCVLYYTYGTISLDQSLKEMERLLPTNRFMRVHRSYIVALSRHHAHGNGKVYLKRVENREIEEIPLGGRYAERFYAYLNHNFPR